MAARGESMDPTMDAQWEQTCSLEPSNPLRTRKRPWGYCVSTDPDGRAYELWDQEITIGRKSSCHVQVRNPAISGVHCRLIKSDHVVFLKDTSTNGVYVNGVKVGKGKRIVLLEGTEVFLMRTPEQRISFKFFFKTHDKNGAPADPASDLEKVYDVRETIGSGAFSTVKACVHKTSGQLFALKIIDKKKFFMLSSTKRDALRDEVLILGKLNHPNIIKLYDVFETPQYLYCVLEYARGGDLFDRLVALNGRAFSEPVVHSYLVQVLSSLIYLQRMNIVHRDLKLENLLLADRSGVVVKLADFGLSRIMESSGGIGSFALKTMCGTPQYLAPEVLFSNRNQNGAAAKAVGGGQAPKGYGSAVDMWSLGVITYVLLVAAPPFPENRLGDVVVRESADLLPDNIWYRISADAKDLVQKMLVVNPSKRITALEAMEHPWVVRLAAEREGRRNAVRAAAASHAESVKSALEDAQHRRRDMAEEASKQAAEVPQEATPIGLAKADSALGALGVSSVVEDNANDVPATTSTRKVPTPKGTTAAAASPVNDLRISVSGCKRTAPVEAEVEVESSKRQRV